MLLHVSVGHSSSLLSSIPLNGCSSSPVDGHLDCLQLRAVLTETVINIHV